MLVGNFERKRLGFGFLGHEIDNHHEGGREIDTIFAASVETESWALVTAGPDGTLTTTGTKESDVVQPGIGIDVGLLSIWIADGGLHGGHVAANQWTRSLGDLGGLKHPQAGDGESAVLHCGSRSTILWSGEIFVRSLPFFHGYGDLLLLGKSGKDLHAVGC